MCTNCNEITIPQGPTRATGATGGTGLPGAAGFDGTDGTNGTTILSAYNSVAGIGTPASLTETTLFTYNVPANTLNVNGDELEALIYFEYTSNDAATLRIKFGSVIFPITASGVDDYTYTIKLKVARISATSQFWTLEYITKSAISLTSEVFTSITSSTLDLTTILAFEVSGQNTVATANTLVLKKTVLYKYAI